MEGTTETIKGSESAASAPSAEMSYPRDPVPTIRDTAAQEALKAEETKEKAQESGTEVKAEVKTEPAKEEVKTEVKAEEKETESEKLDRFDKHPRFIELHEKAKKAEERAAQSDNQFKDLSKRFDELSRHLESLSTQKKEPDLTEDDLADLFDTNPAQALQKAIEIAENKAYSRLTSELSEKESINAKRQHLGEFAKQFPDFNDKWESGELARLVDQNPLHNPISAYLMTAINGVADKHKAELDEINTAHEKAIADAVEAVRKEEQGKAAKQLEEAQKNFQAKKEIRVVDDTPGTTGTHKDSASDLKNAKGHTLHEKMVANLQRLRAAV